MKSFRIILASLAIGVGLVWSIACGEESPFAKVYMEKLVFRGSEASGVAVTVEVYRQKVTWGAVPPSGDIKLFWDQVYLQRFAEIDLTGYTLKQAVADYNEFVRVLALDQRPEGGDEANALKLWKSLKKLFPACVK